MRRMPQFSGMAALMITGHDQTILVMGFLTLEVCTSVSSDGLPALMPEAIRVFTYSLHRSSSFTLVRWACQGRTGTEV